MADRPVDVRGARPRGRLVHEATREHLGVEDLRTLRTDLVTWLRTSAARPDTGALRDRLEDVATAVYEALTNVVDHAYPKGPGPVRLTASLARASAAETAETAETAEHPWLEIEIADQGAWRPAPEDPGHRGRGLLLLARLADGHDLYREEGGTRVRLWWQRPP